MPKRKSLDVNALPTVFEDLKDVTLTSLTTDHSFYPRKAVSESTILKYTELLKSGAVFPPIKVAKLPDSRFLVIDGFMRIAAHENASRKTIRCHVYKVSWQEALRLAATVNRKGENSQGLERSEEDEKKIIRSFFCDDVLSQANNKQISDWTGINYIKVCNMRPNLKIIQVPPQEIEHKRPAKVPVIAGGGRETATLDNSGVVGQENVSEILSGLQKEDMKFRVSSLLKKIIQTHPDTSVMIAEHLFASFGFKEMKYIWDQHPDTAKMFAELGIKKLEQIEKGE